MFNGNGVFERLYSWTNDAAAGIKIRADRMDNETDGIAQGLSTCITKDGQTTVTADLPMSGFNHLNVGNADARNQYAALGQVQDGKANWIAAGGTADVITAAYSPAFPSLSDGQLFFVRATGANTTTTPTFNPSGLGAGTIVKNGNQALAVGDIFGAGHELILRRSGTKYELLNPAVTGVSTLSGNNTFTGINTFTNAINEARGTAIASATTTNIGAATGNFVHITGTTTITGFGTVQAGTRRILTFDGILTLTHNGTSLILPTGANIITAAGDSATFVSEGSGNWRCVDYQRADGSALFSAPVPITPWVAYTPTTTGIGTPSNVSFFSRRVGDSLEIRGRLTAGTASGAAQISLGYNGVGSGFTSDAAKLPTTIAVVGTAGINIGSAAQFTSVVVGGSTYFGIIAQNTGVSPGQGMTAGVVYYFDLSVPIQGW